MLYFRAALASALIFALSGPVLAQGIGSSPGAGGQPPSPGAETPTAGDIDTFEPTPEMLQATTTMWTEEMVTIAPPLPMPVISEDEFQQFLGQAEQQVSDEPLTVESVTGAPGERAMGTPGRVDPRIFPYSAVGKLFFTVGTGGQASCTAEYVANTRIVMTAAHCVYDRQNRRWYTNFQFRRGFAGGGGQVVTVRSASVFTNWYTDSWPYRWDYAFICTNQASQGGYLGFRTFPSGQFPYQRFHSAGYPVNFDSANYMQRVEGTRGQVTNGVVQMLGNPMSFGSSGGAWIGDLRERQSGANNYAIGLNSFKYSNRPQELWGPQFDANTRRLFDHVRSRCT